MLEIFLDIATSWKIFTDELHSLEMSENPEKGRYVISA